MTEPPSQKITTAQSAALYCKKLDTAALVTLIGHKNKHLREMAVLNLQAHADESIADSMTALCRDSNRRLRAGGAAVLGCLPLSGKKKTAEATALLADLALNDTSKEVRRAAVFALGCRYTLSRANRAPILATLAQTAKDADASIRLATTRALGNVEHVGALPLAEDLLYDPDKHVRDWTAFNLLYTGFDSEKIRNGLIAMLGDAYVDARLEAIYVLVKLRDMRVVSALLAELQKQHVIFRILEAAGDLGEASLVPALKDIVRDFAGNGDEGEQIAVRQYKRLLGKVRRQKQKARR